MENIALKNMIDAYSTKKMKEDIQYIKMIKDMSKTISFEEYLKKCLTFFPEHKWFLHLDKSNLHAYRMAYEFLKSNQYKLKNIKCFDDLIVYLEGSNIPKFGELSIYDTAVGVGIAMDIRPDKVFLHAAPRKAMKFILGDKYNKTVKYLKKSNRVQYVDLKNMPGEFNVFNDKSYLIEDCLCYIYRYFLEVRV